jgi:hypothetical protein
VLIPAIRKPVFPRKAGFLMEPCPTFACGFAGENNRVSIFGCKVRMFFRDDQKLSGFPIVGKVSLPDVVYNMDRKD